MCNASSDSFYAGGFEVLLPSNCGLAIGVAEQKLINHGHLPVQLIYSRRSYSQQLKVWVASGRNVD